MMPFSGLNIQYSAFSVPCLESSKMMHSNIRRTLESFRGHEKSALNKATMMCWKSYKITPTLTSLSNFNFLYIW